MLPTNDFAVYVVGVPREVGVYNDNSKAVVFEPIIGTLYKLVSLLELVVSNRLSCILLGNGGNCAYRTVALMHFRIGKDGVYVG